MLKSISLSFARQIVGLNLDTSAPGKHLKSQEASVTDKLPTHNSQISTTPGAGDVSSKNGNNEGQRRELTGDFYSKQQILGFAWTTGWCPALLSSLDLRSDLAVSVPGAPLRHGRQDERGDGAQRGEPQHAGDEQPRHLALLRAGHRAAARRAAEHPLLQRPRGLDSHQHHPQPGKGAAWLGPGRGSLGTAVPPSSLLRSLLK